MQPSAVIRFILDILLANTFGSRGMRDEERSYQRYFLCMLYPMMLPGKRDAFFAKWVYDTCGSEYTPTFIEEIMLPRPSHRCVSCQTPTMGLCKLCPGTKLPLCSACDDDNDRCEVCIAAMTDVEGAAMNATVTTALRVWLGPSWGFQSETLEEIN